jgi:hypothetical protein
MDRDLFVENLKLATKSCYDCAVSIVIDHLPKPIRYIIRPNASYDGNPLEDDEVVFPEDTHRPEVGAPRDESQVVEFFWRDGKVPEWIDLMVIDYDEQFTYVELMACGRFTAGNKHLYHTHGGMQPFSAKSPFIPLGWESAEVSGKIQLHWKQEQNPT